MRHAVPRDSRIRLLWPDTAEPAADDEPLVRRIFESYRKLKEDERSVARVYRPSAMWQANVDGPFASLGQSLASGSPAQMHRFLENFGAWPQDTGIESLEIIRYHALSPRRERHLTAQLIVPLLDAWTSYWNGERPLSALAYPRVGNQAGFVIDGTEFAGLGSFYSDIYGDLLGELVRGIDRPVIGEIGGGYGKLAWFTLRDLQRFAYVDFDIPEVLATAAFYLMKVFPERPALLYGEASYSSASHDAFDLVFMPPWVAESIGDDTVDLFINKNSLGEMEADAARNYVRIISRSARWFFHMNHERLRNDFGGGSRSLVASELGVPLDRFRRIVRYPEIGHATLQPFLGAESDIYLYLYERI